MPDYENIISNIEHALAHCRKAEESMVPIAKVKQVDSYLLGLLQAARLVLTDVRKAANQAAKSPLTKRK